jgi:hypothetical protein
MQAPSKILNQLNSLYVNQGLERRRGEALGAQLATRLHDEAARAAPASTVGDRWLR